jgi:hypothetical protein
MCYKLSNKYTIIATATVDNVLFVYIIGQGGVDIVKWSTLQFIKDQDLIDYLLSVEDDILSGKFNLKLSCWERFKIKIAPYIGG